MEVTVQTALHVPDVSPATMYARIAEEEVRGYHADLVSNRRSNLAAMGHIADIMREYQRVILPATASYATSAWL